MTSNQPLKTIRATDVVLAIHGGAGAIRQDLTPAPLEAALREALDTALQAGWDVLQANGSALAAVEHAIVSLEDCPLFNAGRGAVFAHNGRIELDASIMTGAQRLAGAVAGVHTVKNPIRLARAVMEQSNHVLLVGEGAEEFAALQGLELVPEHYFHTELRRQQLEEARQSDKMMLDAVDVEKNHKFGTVGAVALDRNQQLAAGTSTGGMTNKRFGRVGDSPIVGAGVYADNQTCAVSGTGHGEYFIRAVVCHDISAQMRYAGKSVVEAAECLIFETLPALGGSGGVIALDAHGTLACPFNTAGMYRGWVTRDGTRHVWLWQDR